jgi:hypothetical protein
MKQANFVRASELQNQKQIAQDLLALLDRETSLRITDFVIGVRDESQIWKAVDIPYWMNSCIEDFLRSELQTKIFDINVEFDKL